MALPTVADLRLYLDVEGTAEDPLLTQLLERARGILAAELGRPLTGGAAATTTVAVGSAVPWPAIRSLRRGGIATGAAVGTAASTTVTVAPLDTLPDYGAVVEPMVAQAIIDVAADLYQRRNAAAASEGEAGASVDYDTDIDLPRTARRVVALYGVRS